MFDSSPVIDSLYMILVRIWGTRSAVANYGSRDEGIAQPGNTVNGHIEELSGGASGDLGAGDDEDEYLPLPVRDSWRRYVLVSGTKHFLVGEDVVT